MCMYTPTNLAHWSLFGYGNMTQKNNSPKEFLWESRPPNIHGEGYKQEVVVWCGNQQFWGSYHHVEWEYTQLCFLSLQTIGPSLGGPGIRSFTQITMQELERESMSCSVKWASHINGKLVLDDVSLGGIMIRYRWLANHSNIINIVHINHIINIVHIIPTVTSRWSSIVAM